MRISNLKTEQINPRTVNFSGMLVNERLEIFLHDYGIEAMEAIRKARKEVEMAEKEITERMFYNSEKDPSERSHLIFGGAGTPGRRSRQEAAEIDPTFGVKEVLSVNAGGIESLIKSIEGAEDNYEQGKIDIMQIAKPQDIIFGISASGRTPYVIGVIDKAKEIGCYTISLSNNPNSIIYQKADLGIFVDSGPEIITGSTRLKSDLVHKTIMNFITTSVMTNLGYVEGNIMNGVQPNSEKLKIRRFAIYLSQQTGIEHQEALNLSELLLRSNNFDTEKIKEVCICLNLPVSIPFYPLSV